MKLHRVLLLIFLINKKHVEMAELRMKQATEISELESQYNKKLIEEKQLFEKKMIELTYDNK